MADSVTTPDIEKVRQQINEIRAFLEDVRKVGGSMPALEEAVDRVEGLLSRPMEAAEIGLDLSAAGEEVRRNLAAYTADLKSACGNNDLSGVCEAQIDRLWQARSVRWVLSPNQEGSWVRLSIRNVLRRHTPDILCQRMDWCRAK